ncbi:hypothetical protein [Sphingomonas sp. Mn802worker]|uniref:hypothetical protein n=1 Tax=Sphingomonas sp. Mn802worker TaxID=629773 RepID=UPI0012EA11C6|nr:hypothetical protein [Sphingomonas sp. Mn802worker]
MRAVPTAARALAERRSGTVSLGHNRLSIRSLHGIAGATALSGALAGYQIDTADGTQASLIELTAGGSCRVVVTRDPARRAAALAAVLTLALFGDSGDIG